MNTIITNPPKSSFLNPNVNPAGVLLRDCLDASRGAARLGIRPQVLVHYDIIDTYRELDPAVGSNVVGSVIHVLSLHIAGGRTFVGDEVIQVGLRRREDDLPVEVELLVSRRRNVGRECLALSLAGERTAESRST